MSGKAFRQFALRQIPQFHASIIAAGSQAFAVGTERKGKRRNGREFEFDCFLRPKPEFHLTIGARGEEVGVGAEGERVHDGAVRNTCFVVEAGVDQVRIGEPANELLGWQMVDENPVGARAGGELAVGRDRYGVNRIQPLGQRLPFDGSGDAGGAFRALVNPEFDQAEFLRRQVGRQNFVFGRRHDGVFKLMRRGLEQQAGVAALWHDGRTGIAALEHGLRRFQNQPGLGRGFIMAGEAIVLQNRQNFPLEIHWRRVFDPADRNGTILLGLLFVRANWNEG